MFEIMSQFERLKALSHSILKYFFLHEILKKFRLGPAVPGEIGRDRRPGAGGDSQLRR